MTVGLSGNSPSVLKVVIHHLPRCGRLALFILQILSLNFLQAPSNVRGEKLPPL